MKGIDIFCASQAATAICQSSSSSPSASSSTILLGSRSPAIDRYNPIIRDSRRTAKPLPPSQPPNCTKPHKDHHNKKNKTKKNDGSSYMIMKPDHDKSKVSKQITTNNSNGCSTGATIGRKSWSCTRPGDFISPPGSTRYLLSEKVLFNALSDQDTHESKAVKENESCDYTKLPSSSVSPDQVVVLRVSLHCRGCERKMRKHISRMEGVTSYNIDFASKKVTVTGNITPLEVLSSISKVKNAQLWPASIPSPIKLKMTAKQMV